jgi:hypothetical protein
MNEQKPTCPKCGGTEFTCSPVSMPNNDYWNPVICSNCGFIVGQMPSNDEKEAIEHIRTLLTLEEQLGDIKTLLFAFEKVILKNSS